MQGYNVDMHKWSKCFCNSAACCTVAPVGPQPFPAIADLYVISYERDMVETGGTPSAVILSHASLPLLLSLCPPAAQIYNLQSPSNTPSTTGFTVAAWLNLGGSTVGGTVWERMFNQNDLSIYNSNVECRMPVAAASWSIPSTINTTAWHAAWHHYACTFGE